MTNQPRFTRLAAAALVLSAAVIGAASPAQATCEFDRYLTIDDARGYELTVLGWRVLTVTVRSSVCSHSSTVSYTTVNGSGWFAAMAPDDYTAKSGTLTWAAGDSSDRHISLLIRSDGADEFNEIFSVRLFGATGFTQITDDTGVVTILDDDGPISWNVNDAKCVEDDPTGLAVYTVCPYTVTIPLAQISNVRTFARTGTGGNATPGTDYLAISDYPLTILAGATSVQGTILIRRDIACEGDETLKIVLFDPDTGVLGDSVATMTIVEDDIFCDL